LLGLLYVLSVQPLPVSAAARVGTAREMVESTVASGGVVTVCLGGVCDFDTVQAAVDAADDGDEIRVATGVYTGVNGYGGLAQVLYVSRTVTIRGGYTTTNWSMPDVEANPTTLDAEGQGRVLYITGDISPTIEGFRITGGEARELGGGPGFAPHAGGGVYVDTGQPTIRDTTVAGNNANSGGGLYLNQTEAQLSGNTIISNTARYGAGLALSEGAALIEDNTFEYNSASAFGGGLYTRFSRVDVRGNQVAANSASNGGGGVCLNNGRGTLVGNVVVSNTSAGYGGGLYLFDSGVQLTGNSILLNEAGGQWGGGGLCISGGHPELVENLIIGNQAEDCGGGLSFYGAEVDLVNTILADNQAGGLGGGAYTWGGAYRLLHTTLAGNGSLPLSAGAAGDSAATGGGAMAASDGGSGLYVRESSVALTNTILVGHEVGVYAAAGAAVSLEGTLLGEGEWANGVDWAGEGAVEHQNDYEEAVRFVDPAGGDYHIQTDSGAVDRGADAGVTIDVDGQPRPVGPAADLGADESTGIDLSTSSKLVLPSYGVAVGEVVTYTLALINSGYLTANEVMLTDVIPISTTYVSGSLQAPPGAVITDPQMLVWRGTLPPLQPVTMTFRVTVAGDGLVENMAEVTDEYDTRTLLRALLNGSRVFLPLILQSH
jgi:uncharacterized repeat protein (TIGR01451 family)